MHDLEMWQYIGLVVCAISAIVVCMIPDHKER